MTAELAALVVRLFRVIGVLALPADEQAAVLQKLGTAPLTDELALELHDQILMAPQFVEAGWLTDADVAAARLIDDKLGAISGPEMEELWTLEALESADEWKEVRRLARAFIARI